MGIAEAAEALGGAPLTESGIRRYVRPLFSRTLAEGSLYLAGHTLGRMLDQSADDVAEGMAAWADWQRSAWEPWLAEERRYRAAVAGLLGCAREHCVVPKTSAGHALRAVLNTLEPGTVVLTTDGEFASVATVLARYAATQRLRVVHARPEPDGRWTAEAVLRALPLGAGLVVVSHVFYRDAQVFDGMERLAAGCRAAGARLLVDSYHAAGVLPVSFRELGCDYLIGGCYKYLRGGPGAAFLVLSPEVADSQVRTLDTGWFAGEHGGDTWLEATPAVLPYYQARSGLALTQALGVERLRAYSQRQLNLLREQLLAHGIESVGGGAHYGAFLTVAHPRALEVMEQLAAEGIVCDQRHGFLRLCPDLLTTDAELHAAAGALALLLR